MKFLKSSKYKKFLFLSYLACLISLSYGGHAEAQSCGTISDGDNVTIASTCSNLILDTVGDVVIHEDATVLTINAPPINSAILNLSSTTNSLTNYGSIAGLGDSSAVYGIYNSGGTISRLNNIGDVYVVGNGSRTNAYGIYNILSGTEPGIISELTNSGNITVDAQGASGYAFGVDNRSVISSFANSGSMLISSNGAIALGFNNGNVINNFSNSGSMSIVSNSGAVAALVLNTGNIANLTNSGSMSSIATGAGAAYGIASAGTIDSFVNNDTLFVRSFSDMSVGIWNSSGTISSLINNGTIEVEGSDSYGIYNSGIITVITNNSSASILGNFGIYNLGAIDTLNNSQGAGHSAGALTYAGNLPTNYNIIINSPSNYGQLAITAPNGTTTFGIKAGSIVRNGTYASVLTGITSSNLSSTSGSYGSGSWILSNSSGTIWDLIISNFYSGPSVTNTNQSLVNSSAILQGTVALQNSVMVNSFTYDCPVFDKHGVCVSAGGRNTAVQAQGINNTSGLIIASYRLDKNNSRIGAYADQNISVSGPGTVQLGNNTPMLGVFGVWSERPDEVGIEVKISAAFGQKSTTVTRGVVGTGSDASEAGTGGSNITSQGIQAIAKYGFGVMQDVIISPYVGIRYTQNNLGGYTEATSATVTAPLTYGQLNTSATTVLAGAQAKYKGIPKTTLFASAGIETDTNTANGSYNATNTSIGGLTPVNFNPNPVRTRPTATLGAYYDIVKNQRLGVIGIYRQEAYQAVSTTTVMATYTIGL